MGKKRNEDVKTTQNAPFPHRPALEKAWKRGEKQKERDYETTFYDASDHYANQYHNYIMFTSVISGKAVKFKAFLTTFEDQFKSDWNSEQVYGRNDPIQTFKNTTRTISIGWDCPAGSCEEAKSNMAAAAGLIRMLYPSYERTDNVSTIKKSPMIKVKFRNLVSDPADDTGLLVTIDGINFSPEIEAGWFDADESKTFTEIQEDELIPKLLKFSCTMTVIHRQTIGHLATGDALSIWPEELARFPNLPSGIGSSHNADLDFDFTDDFITKDQNKFNKEELEAHQKAIGPKASEAVVGDASLPDDIAKIAAYHDGLNPFASDSAGGAGFSLSAGFATRAPKIFASAVNPEVNSFDLAGTVVAAKTESDKKYYEKNDGNNK